MCNKRNRLGQGLVPRAIYHGRCLTYRPRLESSLDMDVQGREQAIYERTLHVGSTWPAWHAGSLTTAPPCLLSGPVRDADTSRVTLTSTWAARLAQCSTTVGIMAKAHGVSTADSMTSVWDGCSSACTFLSVSCMHSPAVLCQNRFTDGDKAWCAHPDPPPCYICPPLPATPHPL